jgi:hypothetical protein
MPNVGPDFKPYATNGHWVLTDGGWTWASDYPWGWATFHYGRWFFEDGYGWMWIPGHEWAPAWVSWRRSDDYYGWAPLGPSVSISVSLGGGYNPPPHYWNFVPHQYITSPHVNNYYVNEQKNVTIINNTTVIRNTTIVNNTVNNTTIVNNNVTNNHVTVNNYAGGPDVQEVSRVTGTPVRPVALRESNTPGEQVNGSALAIYRPRVAPPAQSNNGGTQPRSAPSQVQTLNNVHPVNTAIYNNNRGTINNTNVTNNTTNNNNINNNTTNNNTNINNNINNSRNTNVNNNNINTNNTTNNVNVNNNNRPAANPSNPIPPPAGYGQPANRPANPMIGNQPASQPVNQPAYRPANQPAALPATQPANQSANRPPVQNPPPPRPRSFQTPGQPVASPPSPNHPLLNQQPNQAFVRPAAPNNASRPNQPLPPPRPVNNVKPVPKKDTVSHNRPRPQ